MGITRAVIGAVAAAGVARLLAPRETDELIDGAKRAVTRTAKTAKRKAASVTRAATRAAPKKSSAKPAAKKKAAKAAPVRKAAKRPARKDSR